MTSNSIRSVQTGPITFGDGSPLAIISGPCVIEGREPCLEVARRLADLAAAEEIPLVFKASFDKANRTSVDGFRGPGLEAGLEILAAVKEETGLPLLTDFHTPEQAAPVAEVVDILQIPAFLCRQTDLVIAAGESGATVNIKKGQFLAPWDVGHVVKKVESTGNRKILVTERGASFGYNTLVTDFRALIQLRDHGYPVVFDATHSVQKPGGGGGFTAGDGKMAPPLSRAAVAVGCHAVFMETHLNPAEAKSDRENAIPFDQLAPLWRRLKAIHALNAAAAETNGANNTDETSAGTSGGAK